MTTAAAIAPSNEASLYLVYSWLVAFLAFSSLHLAMFAKLVKMELSPYNILHTRQIRGRLLSIDVIVIFSFVVLLYLLSNPIASPIMTNQIVSTLMAHAILSIIGFSLVIYFLVLLGGISNHKETRLSFKTVLIGLKAIYKERSSRPRPNPKHLENLVKKHVKWFKNGLNSYNRYLYRLSPSRLEIVNIEQYYRAVFSVIMMGEKQEMALTIEQVEKALNCLGRKIPYFEMRYDDLRLLLTALKNIKSVEAKEKYPIRELTKMARVTSRSDRAKRFLGSPYGIALVGLLPLLDIVLRVFL